MKKADVEIHSDGYRPARPAVNVKVHDAWYWWGDDKEAIVSSVRNELGADETFDLAYVREVLERDDEGTWFYTACEQAWEILQDDASIVFDDYNVKVWSEGRQGGWAVVDGLPDLDTWDAIMVARWARFARYARILADDVPRSMVWLICANVWEPARDQHREDMAAAAAEGVLVD